MHIFFGTGDCPATARTHSLGGHYGKIVDEVIGRRGEWEVAGDEMKDGYYSTGIDEIAVDVAIKPGILDEEDRETTVWTWGFNEHLMTSNVLKF